MLNVANDHTERRMYTNTWWRPPNINQPTIGIRWSEWRGYQGGITFALRTPVTNRAIAIFDDPAVARAVHAYETAGNLRRSVLYLTLSEGKWYASMKYRSGKGVRHGRTGN